MSFSKFILVFISSLFVFTVSCKKHDTLPELGIGNNMNPIAGVEYVNLDSTRIYYAPGKKLKSYISIKENLISEMGFTWSKINVYKNGIFSVFFSNPGGTIKSFTDNVISGQVLQFEFTVVDTNGRESKKSIPYIITVP